MIALAAGYFRKQSAGYVIRWFISYKLLTFATLFSIMFLIAGALISNYAHYSTILFAGGMVCAVMFIGIVEPMLHKKVEKPVKISKVWAFIGLIAGTFAIVAAWGLFPNITTREGWITFSLLVIAGATFLLRAIVAFQFHIWLPTFVASFTATNAPNWINPNIGGVITLTHSTVLFITAVVTAVFWIVLTVVLLWLNHSEIFISRILNSPPLLMLTAVMSLIWAGMMVWFQWPL